MSKTKSMVLLGSSVVLLASAALAWQGVERQLKDLDLTKFSKALGSYFEAKAEGKGVLEAEVEVSDEAQALGRKLAKAKSTDILAFPADLGQALWLSHDYPRKKFKKGKVTEVTYTERFYSKDNPLEFVVALPNNYQPKERWPVILAIPPADQKPGQHLGEDWESGDFRDGAILAVPTMPSKVEDWTDRAGTAAVLVTLQQVMENYAVDPDRVYLAGTGDGVRVALALSSRYSWMFAGVIGRRGDAGEVSAAGFCNLPSYLAGGGAQATAFEAKVKELGFGNCTLAPSADLPSLWTWMQAHPRVSYPSKIDFWPSLDLVRSNWLEISRGSASEGAHIQASIDAGSNTITIEGSGVPSVTVHLTDALVDLDRPLRILANGVSKEVKVVRSLKLFTDKAFFGQIDAGQVYVASELVSLPAQATEGGEKAGEGEEGGK
ncbi:MAG: hypothetical protein H6830_04160 [Planctomycetes bacterium]|nr:hypothetical protein [Planctomycetota bacterium]MCB9910432.1 hypothetical protein [Planctomycetota bacterium]MCB9912558.1 hypothetical protein [Planctomycetota bacterium]HRV81141.1 hypothetical protein [Planctomycetota bacterium]